MHTQNHSHPHTPHESPDTELHRHQLACLCADGSLEGVDFILGHSPDLIHQPLAQSWYGIDIAARHNRQELVDYLYTLTHQEHSALANAIDTRHHELAMHLIAKGFDVNTPNSNGSTPLHLATLHMQHETIKALLQHPKIDLHKVDCQGKKPILISIELDDLEGLKLFAPYVDLTEISSYEQNGTSIDHTYLQKAILHKADKVFKHLITIEGIQLNHSSLHTRSALEYALALNLTEMTHSILNHPKLKINGYPDAQQAPLEIIIEHQNLELAEKFIREKGATLEPWIPGAQDKMHLIHRAITDTRLPILKWLIEGPLKINPNLEMIAPNLPCEHFQKPLYGRPAPNLTPLMLTAGHHDELEDKRIITSLLQIAHYLLERPEITLSDDQLLYMGIMAIHTSSYVVLDLLINKKPEIMNLTNGYGHDIFELAYLKDYTHKHDPRSKESAIFQTQLRTHLLNNHLDVIIRTTESKPTPQRIAALLMDKTPIHTVLEHAIKLNARQVTKSLMAAHAPLSSTITHWISAEKTNLLAYVFELQECTTEMMQTGFIYGCHRGLVDTLTVFLPFLDRFITDAVCEIVWMKAIQDQNTALLQLFIDHLSITEALLKKGFTISCINGAQKTVLWFLDHAGASAEEALEIALKHDAFNLSHLLITQNRLALMPSQLVSRICEHQAIQTLESLLTSGRLSLSTLMDGKSLLQIALSTQKPKVIRFLLSRKELTTHQRILLFPSLCEAQNTESMEGYLKTLPTPADQKSAFTAKDTFGRTGLQNAGRTGSIEWIKTLLNHAARLYRVLPEDLTHDLIRGISEGGHVDLLGEIQSQYGLQINSQALWTSCYLLALSNGQQAMANHLKQRYPKWVSEPSTSEKQAVFKHLVAQGKIEFAVKVMERWKLTPPDTELISLAQQARQHSKSEILAYLQARFPTLTLTPETDPQEGSTPTASTSLEEAKSHCVFAPTSLVSRKIAERQQQRETLFEACLHSQKMRDFFHRLERWNSVATPSDKSSKTPAIESTFVRLSIQEFINPASRPLQIFLSLAETPEQLTLSHQIRTLSETLLTNTCDSTQASTTYAQLTDWMRLLRTALSLLKDTHGYSCFSPQMISLLARMTHAHDQIFTLLDQRTNWYTSTPDSDTPDSDTPDSDTPDSDTPDSDTPNFEHNTTAPHKASAPELDACSGGVCETKSDPADQVFQKDNSPRSTDTTPIAQLYLATPGKGAHDLTTLPWKDVFKQVMLRTHKLVSEDYPLYLWVLLSQENAHASPGSQTVSRDTRDSVIAALVATLTQHMSKLTLDTLMSSMQPKYHQAITLSAFKLMNSPDQLASLKTHISPITLQRFIDFALEIEPHLEIQPMSSYSQMSFEAHLRIAAEQRNFDLTQIASEAILCGRPVDLLLAHLVVVQYDGAHHEQGSQPAKDRDQDQTLLASGIRVIFRIKDTAFKALKNHSVRAALFNLLLDTAQTGTLDTRIDLSIFQGAVTVSTTVTSNATGLSATPSPDAP